MNTKTALTKEQLIKEIKKVEKLTFLRKINIILLINTLLLIIYYKNKKMNIRIFYFSFILIIRLLFKKNKSLIFIK